MFTAPVDLDLIAARWSTASSTAMVSLDPTLSIVNATAANLVNYDILFYWGGNVKGEVSNVLIPIILGSKVYALASAAGVIQLFFTPHLQL